MQFVDSAMIKQGESEIRAYIKGYVALYIPPKNL
jgi:hypothetical protein